MADRHGDALATVAEVALVGLAAGRVARLIGSDVITATPREWAIRWLYSLRDGEGDHVPQGQWTDLARSDGPDAPRLATLIVCGWCASVWAAAALTLLARERLPGARLGVRVLAAAQVAGMINARS